MAASDIAAIAVAIATCFPICKLHLGSMTLFELVLVYLSQPAGAGRLSRKRRTTNTLSRGCRGRFSNLLEGRAPPPSR
jgi:hypothetical protein